MTSLERKQHVLDLITPTLEDDGYSVVRRPTRRHLPTFMAGYIPDALAMGKPKNLAIEVVPGEGAAQSHEDIAGLIERFAGQPDWERRVYYFRPESDDIALAPVSRKRLEAAIADVAALSDAGRTEAALLMGWSTLEALGRHLLPKRLLRPVSARRLLEVIASHGIVTPDEAERLRRLRPLRDRVAHGDLGASIEPAQLTDLVSTLRVALQEAETDVPAE